MTVVSGLRCPDAVLKGLVKELKTACGSGGTLKAGDAGAEIEIQGDQRQRVEVCLREMGFQVKT